MRSWSVANATNYQPNWGTLNFKNSCLHPHSELGYYNDSAWDPQKSFAAVWQASLPQLKFLQHWTNFYFSFTDCILTMLDPGAGGGGYSAENGIQLCAALKTLLSRPPDPSLKPPFQNFLVPQDPTFAWNHKFLENLHFKGSKSLNKLLL